MRIDHVIPYVGDEGSGPAYSVPALLAAQAVAGHEVHLHVLEPGPDLTGVQVHAYKRSTFPHPDLGWSTALNKSIRAGARAADVLHNHSLWMMPNIEAGRAASKAQCPFVCSPRGTLHPAAWARSRMRKRLVWLLGQGRALREVALFHATSQRENDHLRSRGFQQPVVVLPNGVDVPPAVARPSLDTRRIGFLGRLHRIKGLDRLLSAWELTASARPDWELSICGPDGGYLRQLRAQARAVPRVRFEGPLFGEAKWEWYRTCELFVLPSHSENFGMALAEALASGVPAIASTGTPWHGLVLRNAGWWVDNEPGVLSEAILMATAASPAALRERGLAGRRWMKEEFGWASISRKLTDAYLWMLGRGEQPDCVYP